jgi:hypothetical protein
MSEGLFKQVFFGLKMEYHYALRNTRTFCNTRDSCLRKTKLVDTFERGLDELLFAIFALDRAVSTVQIFFGYAGLHLSLRWHPRASNGHNLMLSECLVNQYTYIVDIVDFYINKNIIYIL